MATSPLSNNFQLVSANSTQGNRLPEARNVNVDKVSPNTQATPKAPTKSPQPAQENDLSRQSIAELKAELQKFNENSSNIQRSLKFKVDDETGRSVISVVDRQTNETIRQIPPEELLTLSRRLKELNEALDSSSGVLIRTEA